MIDNSKHRKEKNILTKDKHIHGGVRHSLMDSLCSVTNFHRYLSESEAD